MLLPQELKTKFLLRNDITYLNFGSFGACPRTVFEDYQRWQLELEQEPVQFMTHHGPRYIEQSRVALANFIGCAQKDIVFVTNPSYGVNIIAKSLDLQEGDEVLTTNIEYGACDKTWAYYCRKQKAIYKRQPIPLPVTSKEQIVEDLFAGVTSRTKLIFVSHITSSTGLILPVKEICAKAKLLGILTFVDGAHAPGHISLHIEQLGADMYTGACHKWMMTPKGSSFLYVKKEWQHLFDPLIVSWGYNSATPSDSLFQDYHQLQGTRDFSAFLTIPAALHFMEEHNWHQVAARCRALVQTNAEHFCKLVGTTPLSPIHDDFIGQLLSIPIHTNDPIGLQQHLFDVYKIEIPVMTQDGKVYLRYSIQGFNGQEDLDMLYKAVKEIKVKTNLIE